MAENSVETIQPPEPAALNGIDPSSTDPIPAPTGTGPMSEAPAKKGGPRWTPPDPNGTSEHSRLSRERWAQARAMGLDHPPPIPKHMRHPTQSNHHSAPPNFTPPMGGHFPHPPVAPQYGYGYAGQMHPHPLPYNYGAYAPYPGFNTPGYMAPPLPMEPYGTGFSANYPPLPAPPFPMEPYGSGFSANFVPLPVPPFPMDPHGPEVSANFVPLPVPPLPMEPDGTSVSANFTPLGTAPGKVVKVKKQKKPMMSDEKPSETRLLVKKLPIDVTRRDIVKFFMPDRCVEIKLGLNRGGHQNGEAIVEFETSEMAKKVLARTRGSIRGHPLQLFPTSQVASRLRRVQWKAV